MAGNRKALLELWAKRPPRAQEKSALAACEVKGGQAPMDDLGLQILRQKTQEWPTDHKRARQKEDQPKEWHYKGEGANLKAGEY